MGNVKSETPNPAGRRGKPIVVPNMSLDSALRKILTTPPESKPSKPKITKRKSSKKR